MRPLSKAMARVLAVVIAAVVLQTCECALNVGSAESENMVTRLRRSIFVETAYLEERQGDRCSSLDGPGCWATLLGGTAGATEAEGRAAAAAASLAGFGVIPDGLLHDLGVAGNDVEFVTPVYDVLEAFRRQHEIQAHKEALPLLAGEEASALLRDARAGAERGILHFSNLQLDTRVPLTFSRDLPKGVFATWDGKWLVRDCYSAGAVREPLALPPPESSVEDPQAPALPAVHDLMPPYAVSPSSNSATTVSVAAQLAGSIGYLRFSKPVVLRSLFARWLPPVGAPPAVVGGRLGLQSVWTTHLDPVKLRGVRGWIDISGKSLEPVDEVVFVATRGLEVGAMEVVSFAGEDEERSVLLISPVAASSNPANSEDGLNELKFTLQLRRIVAAAAPYIASLQEVVDRNLRLRAAPPSRAIGQQRGAHIPGLLASGSPPMQADAANVTWLTRAATNQAIFEHRALAQIVLSNTVPGLSALGGGGTKDLAATLADPGPELPADLRKQLPSERQAIVEALFGWISGGGGWHRSTPTTLPQNGTEDALLRYTTAKKWQTKLDILTAVLLHQRRSSSDEGSNTRTNS